MKPIRIRTIRCNETHCLAEPVRNRLGVEVFPIDTPIYEKMKRILLEMEVYTICVKSIQPEGEQGMDS